MSNSIIKEIGIVLIAFVLIALLLGILLYDYVPLNKTVPVQVTAYKMSDELKNELGTEASAEKQMTVKTYTIEGSELDLYEKEDDYDKGKNNPFASMDGGTVTIITNEENNENTNTNNNQQDTEPNINSSK